MQQIDLDDLPPKVARMLEGLVGADEVMLVRSGLVVARLSVVDAPAAATAQTPETDMADVMEHFGAIIEDEF